MNISNYFNSIKFQPINQIKFNNFQTNSISFKAGLKKDTFEPLSKTELEREIENAKSATRWRIESLQLDCKYYQKDIEICVKNKESFDMLLQEEALVANLKAIALQHEKEGKEIMQAQTRGVDKRGARVATMDKCEKECFQFAKKYCTNHSIEIDDDVLLTFVGAFYNNVGYFKYTPPQNFYETRLQRLQAKLEESKARLEKIDEQLEIYIEQLKIDRRRALIYCPYFADERNKADELVKTRGFTRILELDNPFIKTATETGNLDLIQIANQTLADTLDSNNNQDVIRALSHLSDIKSLDEISARYNIPKETLQNLALTFVRLKDKKEDSKEVIFIDTSDKNFKAIIETELEKLRLENWGDSFFKEGKPKYDHISASALVKMGYMDLKTLREIVESGVLKEVHPNNPTQELEEGDFFLDTTTHRFLNKLDRIKKIYEKQNAKKD